jgi:hypothetical protein
MSHREPDKKAEEECLADTDRATCQPSCCRVDRSSQQPALLVSLGPVLDETLKASQAPSPIARRDYTTPKVSQACGFGKSAPLCPPQPRGAGKHTILPLVSAKPGCWFVTPVVCFSRHHNHGTVSKRSAWGHSVVDRGRNSHGQIENRAKFVTCLVGTQYLRLY